MAFEQLTFKSVDVRPVLVSLQRPVVARVGRFDLPRRLLWVTTSDDGKRDVKQIELRNHRLAKPKTAAR